MNTENKNLFILIASSLAILLGYHYFFEKPRLEKLQAEKRLERAANPTPKASQDAVAPQKSAQALAQKAPSIPEKTIAIANGKVTGSFTNKGFSFQALKLNDYKETTDSHSPQVTLLENTEKGYQATFGWSSADASLKLPNEDTLWHTEGDKLTPTTPVIMTWDNGEGLLFKRVIEIDENYMMTIQQTVHNKTTRSIALKTHASVERTNPKTSGYVVLHEGAVGYLDNKLKEVKYDDLKKEKLDRTTSQGGWLGLTDKYWLVALVPDQNVAVDVTYRADNTRSGVRYAAGFSEPTTTVASGKSFTASTRFYAGAKSLETLEHAENLYNIPHFDLAIDFGWFYFITKPLFFAVKWLYTLLGNFGLAIIALTILVRLSFYPLAGKSFYSMAKMRELQPQIARLKENCGEDKMRFQKEMMALYKKHSVNPVAGCIPMMVQIPVFFALYKVLFVTIEMRHAPFFGWIHDLSAPDPTSLFNLFGLINWTPPSFLMIGVLPLIMGVSMYVQQQLNPPSADPIQEKVFKFMPLIFLFMLASFPAGLVLYWICSNIFSILQQWAQIKKREKMAASRS